MKAVILAAGKGTRMRELTNELPKPMLRVQGRPILEHIIEGIKSAGVREFFIVTGCLKPLIVTIGDGVDGAEFLLKNAGLADRVDVLDAGQFLTANVYERSFFKAAECKVTLRKLLERYNEIVASCETDPALLIKLSEAKAR